jgi:hypothetical protein
MLWPLYFWLGIVIQKTRLKDKVLFKNINYLFTKNMKQIEESKNNEPLKAKDKVNKIRTTLTHEENMKILQYPVYFRGALAKAALLGESIEEAYKELEIFDYMG